MATDVDVQFFSHLNGLTLSNTWGDLIRLLDKTLVTGIDFTEIISASINEQGDVTINLYAAHNAMLFQVVELSGFSPESLNQKYRIKGVPSANQLILKPKNEITERIVLTRGAGKLVSLGYEIIFRDTNDVKRVYRAKNPTAQHPFIRVDESLASDMGSYTSTYAKSAMVGLLEHMNHIDDCENPNIQQLPFNPSDPAKNWKITGTGTSVIRGWSKWYYALTSDWAANNPIFETDPPPSGNRPFTLVGDKDVFYIARNTNRLENWKGVIGCGITNPSYTAEPKAAWFLMTSLKDTIANTSLVTGAVGGLPLIASDLSSRFYLNSLSASVAAHAIAIPILPAYNSGNSTLFNASLVGALEVPFYDDASRIRGSLKHICYAGKVMSDITVTTPQLAENSMYVRDRVTGSNNSVGGFYFYLGELE